MNERGKNFAFQSLEINFLLFLFKESSFFIIEKRYLFMGQKTHPVSLRLSLNRTFDSLWYTDQYSRLLHQDQSLRKILSSVFRSCGFLSGRLFVQIFPKKTLISLCFHETNADRLQKYTLSRPNKSLTSFVSRLNPSSTIHVSKLSMFCSKTFEVSQPKVRSVQILQSFLLGWSGLFNTMNSKNLYSAGLHSKNKRSQEINEKALMMLRSKTSSHSSKEEASLLESSSTQFPGRELSFLLDSIKMNKFLLLQSSGFSGDFSKRIFSENFFPGLESRLSSQTKGKIEFYPLRIESKYWSAELLCGFLCQRLQEGVPFRSLAQQLTQEARTQSHIQGFRFRCAGRLGGVELARVESKTYGRTSLHVYSEHIDYASSSAWTPSGLLGVKVWLSFRS
jgi:ribosomal protein S3